MLIIAKLHSHTLGLSQVILLTVVLEIVTPWINFLRHKSLMVLFSACSVIFQFISHQISQKAGCPKTSCGFQELVVERDVC